jgi:hypothetical protein
MPWFFVLLQRLNRRECVKPRTEDQILSGSLSNLRVASLEGVRPFVRFSAFSDKPGHFCAFDNKQLMELALSE